MDTPSRHVLTVDVEDWNEAFGRQGLPEGLRHTDSRVEQATERVLEMMGRHGARGTFFVLGTVATKAPGLVRKIAAFGHRIGSHGWEHRSLDYSSPELLRRHLADSRKLLQDLSGQDIQGFRAPWFSLTRRTSWAAEVIRAAGFRYDSSIFPVWNPVYGQAGVPLGIHRIEPDLFEVPPAAFDLGPLRVPIAGGFYWRLLPCSLIERGIERVARQGRPAVLYLHPWELDLEQPRVWMGAMGTPIHYLNLGRLPSILESVLGRWTVAAVEEVFPEVCGPDAK